MAGGTRPPRASLQLIVEPIITSDARQMKLTAASVYPTVEVEVMRIQVVESKQASVAAVAMAAVALILFQISYLNARLETSSLAITFVGYVFSSIFAAASLIFMVFYARNKIVIAIGIIIIAILCVLLSKCDPAYIAYWIARDNYLAEVARTTGPGPKFIVFKLKEGFGFPAGGAWEYVIFDSTNEIGLPLGERTQEWQRSHGGYVTPPAQNCEIITRRLEGHFFYLMQRC
jgi:hypothetical protein